MRAILWAEICQLRRQPGMYLLMTLLTLLFAIAFGQSTVSEIVIPVFSEDYQVDQGEHVVKQLNLREERIRFQWTNAAEAKEQVDSGRAEAAVELTEKGYRLYMTGQTLYTSLVEQSLIQVTGRENWVNTLAEIGGEPREKIQEKVESTLEQPILDLQVISSSPDTEFIYDQQVQSVFGMTLFFVIFTITYTVTRILERKRGRDLGPFNLSSVNKGKMFCAYLLYGFVMGYVQILLVFSLFRVLFGMDFGGAFGTVLLLCIPYVFVITALGTCLSAFIRSPQQLDAVIPLIAVSMAMLGGAYWPLEIVTNDVLLFIAKFIPLTYAMEMLKGVVLNGYGWQDLFYPLGVLLVMGVVLMGVGINVMERRNA